MISILIPIYNTPVEYIKECFESVDNQSMQDYEVVIVNDGSDEEISKYLDSIQKVKYKIYHKERGGISAALNYGLNLCSYNLVCRMDADDIMISNRLEKQYDYFKSNSVDILGSQMELFGDQSSKTNHPLIIPRGIMNVSDWFMNHPTIMFEKDKIIKSGGYNSNFDGLEDLELWCRCLSLGFSLRNLPDILVKHRRHSSNATVKNNINVIMQKIFFVRNHYKI